MKATECFVQTLERLGVQRIFGVPGEDDLLLLDAIRASSQIEYVVARHENAAAIMASCAGRLTGLPGVVMTTAGPGATNALNACGQALQCGFPMVIITAQKPERSEKYQLAQILDLNALFRPVCKDSLACHDGEMLCPMLIHAFRLAVAQRPGPVHIVIAEDIQATTADESAMENMWDRLEGRLSSDTANAACCPSSHPMFQKAVDTIAHASRPLVVVAQGAHEGCLDAEYGDMLSDALASLVRSLGLFFISTPMGKGSINEKSPRWLGSSVYETGDVMHLALQQADVIIVIGLSPYERPLFRTDTAVLAHLKVVHVTACAMPIMSMFCPHVEIVGNLSLTVAALTRDVLAKVKRPNNAEAGLFPELATFHKFKDALESPFHALGIHDRLSTAASVSLSEPRPGGAARLLGVQEFTLAVHEVAPLFDPIVILDEGQYKSWMVRNYAATDARSFLVDHAYSTMAWGLPAAISCSLLYPHRKIILVVGDGGLQMSLSEVETAVRTKCNLSVLLLKDNEFGEIATKQTEVYHVERFGVRFGNPDFAKLVDAFVYVGAQVRTFRLPRNEASTSATLKEAIRSSCDHVGFSLLEIPISYEEGNAVLFGSSILHDLKLKLAI
eukprot:ANDGO_02856.mRNA.1 Acetolactate synthase